jgi:hypothetical protein
MSTTSQWLEDLELLAHQALHLVRTLAKLRSSAAARCNGASRQHQCQPLQLFARRAEMQLI